MLSAISEMQREDKVKETSDIYIFFKVTATTEIYTE